MSLCHALRRWRQVSDYIYFSPHFAFQKHAVAPAMFPSRTTALEHLLPSLSVPSDHMPVACDFSLPPPGAAGLSTPYLSAGGLTWLKVSFGAAAFSTPVALDALVAQLGAPPSAVLGCLKGYGSGLEDVATQPAHIQSALQALEGIDVLLFDGDWWKPDSFTALVVHFLAQRPARRAVAFRKSPAPQAGHNFWASWDEADATVRGRELPDGLDGRLGLIEVEPDAYDVAMRELSSLGIPEADLNYTSLGWITLTHTRCAHTVAIGGGATAANEARACVAKRRRDGEASTPGWTILDVGRTTKNGPERPAALLEMAAALSAS